MKILIGVLLALLAGLGWTAWQLRESWAREGEIMSVLQQTQGALAVATKQNENLVGRFDAFDRSLQRLDAQQAQRQADLTGRLNTIRDIVAEPGDSDASISCLDVRVPAQLDRSLR